MWKHFSPRILTSWSRRAAWEERSSRLAFASSWSYGRTPLIRSAPSSRSGASSAPSPAGRSKPRTLLDTFYVRARANAVRGREAAPLEPTRVAVIFVVADLWRVGGRNFFPERCTHRGSGAKRHCRCRHLSNRECGIAAAVGPRRAPPQLRTRGQSPSGRLLCGSGVAGPPRGPRAARLQNPRARVPAGTGRGTAAHPVARGKFSIRARWSPSCARWYATPTRVSITTRCAMTRSTL